MKRRMKPVHPGAIFREDILKELHLTITEAAKLLQVSRKQLSEVVNERASVTADMAVRIQQVFGAAAEFWLDLQKKHDIYLVEQSGQIRLKRLNKRKSAAA